jgi:hypothetical protein
MNEWELHRTGFTERTLAAAMKKIGFRVVNLVHEPFISIVEEHQDTCYQITAIAEREA